MLGGCRFHFSLCVPHDGFIAFIFSGAFTAPTNQVVCLDKIECLRLDRTSACVTEFTAFWMTKWVGSNTLTNLEKSSKIDKKSAMQKLRVFTAISQNNCIALFNLVAGAGFEPTTFGL